MLESVGFGWTGPRVRRRAEREGSGWEDSRFIAGELLALLCIDVWFDFSSSSCETFGTVGRVNWGEVL